jgi:hypothetical protein
MSLEDEVRLRQMVKASREAIETRERAHQLAAQRAAQQAKAELESKINEFEKSTRSMRIFLTAMAKAGNPGLVRRQQSDIVGSRGFFGVRRTPRWVEGWDIMKPSVHDYTDGMPGYTESGLFLSVTGTVYRWDRVVPSVTGTAYSCWDKAPHQWLTVDDFIKDYVLVRIMAEHGVTP